VERKEEPTEMGDPAKYEQQRPRKKRRFLQYGDADSREENVGKKKKKDSAKIIIPLFQRGAGL